VLTLEDHAILGGFGSAVAETLAIRNEDAGKVKIQGIPDHFLQHASRKALLKHLHLDPDGIADAVRMLAAGQSKPTPDDRPGPVFTDGTTTQQ